MMARLIAAKIQAGRKSHVFGFKKMSAEREGIPAKRADIGVQIEGALRLYGNAKAQLAQGGQQEVTTTTELGAARFQNLQGLRGKQANAACWAMLGALM